ncbi:hypothetical protein ED236_07240 [Pseudomethylobacillus aquaticus]|uniref:Uncharacterized protein n=1 Tax=Pseudomethylobacillus aquaticus TaxID=2676064 RepID=A0A3N0V175_9PROT|nr:hypothetical protein [Pseudomethylobacillus aquaticus]ROH86228.1 hypothetical protein ED236_07240 [Pseudomethylobacillus aquaticus]
MDILNSGWLISMSKKSGKTPQARLLALFDLLDDWLEAPQIRDNISKQTPAATPGTEMFAFLSEQARAAGALLPELLAQQLYAIAYHGLLQALCDEKPHHALLHAKKAAGALIAALTEKERRPIKAAYVATAGLMVASFVLGGWLWQSTPAVVVASANAPAPVAAMPVRVHNNPANIAEIYATMEQMRKGVCQFPEALQLPDAHKKVYLELVVQGKIPTEREDQLLAKALMEKVRCNYTPMLMANSIS